MLFLRFRSENRLQKGSKRLVGSRRSLEVTRLGVRNIVALRGDPPRGQEKWTATEGGFSSALDLVKPLGAH